MSSQQQGHSADNFEVKKRKRGESRNDKETPRYQCYCEKIYLSYPALYLHLKNKHPECFLNNRKIEVTKFKESMTPEGYKILRMEREVNENNKPLEAFEEYKSKSMPPFPFRNYNPFSYPSPQNFMMPTIDPKQFYMQSSLRNNSLPIPQGIPSSTQQNMRPYNGLPQPVPKPIVQQMPESQVVIESNKSLKSDIIALTNEYISQTVTQGQWGRRQVMEIELLFSLLPKCIRQNADRLKGLYNLDVDPTTEDLLKTSNLKYLETLLPYFRTTYLPAIVSKQQSMDPTRQQKLFQAMAKVNKYFRDLSQANKEVKRFQEWLVEREIVERFQQGVGG